MTTYATPERDGSDVHVIAANGWLLCAACTVTGTHPCINETWCCHGPGASASRNVTASSWTGRLAGCCENAGLPRR